MEPSQPGHELVLRSRDSLQFLRGLPTYATAAFASSCFCMQISPQGTHLALADSQGLVVVETENFRPELRVRRQGVQQVYFSPLGNYLASYEKFSSDSNLFLWRIGSDTPVYSFVQRKFFKEQWPYLKFTPDEQYMLWQANASQIYIYQVPGQEFTVFETDIISLFSVCPSQPLLYFAFRAEERGETARIGFYQGLEGQVLVEKTFQKAQEVRPLWSPNEPIMLAWCQTDVDTTGRNYYGEHSLYLINTGVAKVVKTNEGPIYDVAWSPRGHEFIVISGYMPGKTVLYRPNGVKLKEIAQHHRNTIRWNPFGDLFIIAGFGNLQGEIEIWSREDLTLVGNCRQAATVTCEWAPCGRIFVCATLTPRVRVDNGYQLYSYNGDQLMNVLNGGELWEVAWRPRPGAFQPQPLTPRAEPVNMTKKAFRAPNSSSDFNERFKALKGASGPTESAQPKKTSTVPGMPAGMEKKKKRRNKKKAAAVQ